MKSITITQEGARRLLAVLDTDGDDGERAYDAVSAAADGDFGPIAALVGDGGAGEAVAAIEFREGDRVRLSIDNLEAYVTAPPDAAHGWKARVAAEDGNLYDVPAASMTLVSRVRWRAGERCPVAVKQDRVHPDFGAVRIVAAEPGGAWFRYAGTEGGGSAAASTIAKWPLAADFVSPTPIKVKP